MGKFKEIQTEIDEIIRLAYLLGDFSTPNEFTEIVYAKCLDADVSSRFMDYTDKRIGEVMYGLN
jgi:hypothetical protein|tara:strand:+ start:2125 stop:2316 length:192 start_codon:yes stop_codon:yes gene_type:complete